MDVTILPGIHPCPVKTEGCCLSSSSGAEFTVSAVSKGACHQLHGRVVRESRRGSDVTRHFCHQIQQSFSFSVHYSGQSFMPLRGLPNLFKSFDHTRGLLFHHLPPVI